MAKNKKILVIISATLIILLITTADILLKSYFTKQQKENLKAQQIIDTIKPEIIGAKDITIKQGDTIDLTQNIKVEDNIDKNIPLVITGDIDTNKVGEYEITYTATDKSNNKAEQTIKIKIEPKELTQEAANESNQIPKEQSQSTTNSSASTNSKQPIHQKSKLTTPIRRLPRWHRKYLIIQICGFFSMLPRILHRSN